MILVWAPAVLALLVLAGGAAWFAGSRRWRAATADLESRLADAEAATSPDAARVPPRVDLRDLQDLPPPVQRYFRAVLRDGAPRVAAAIVEHEGRFNLAAAGERWVRFRSRQQVTVTRPGFVWDARMAIVPGLAVFVHDAYMAGEGLLHAALFGLVDLASLRDRDVTARGELMRYLAEAAWTPTALLPRPGLRWDAVDGDQARATLTDEGLAVSLTFRFRADGLIDSVHAEERGRTVGGRVVPTRWEGHWSDWREQDGMSVPFVGEVAWLLPEGRQPYWRATITSLRYRFAP